LPLDVRQCFQASPALAQAPLFEDLARGEPERPPGPADGSFRRALASLSPTERRGALEHHVREHAAQVLGLPPARIDVKTPLGQLGCDSLMTLELRNKLEASLGLKLSATIAFNYPTISALTEYFAWKLDLGSAGPPPAPSSPVTHPPGRGAAVRDLSEDEAAAALVAKLGRFEHGVRHG